MKYYLLGLSIGIVFYLIFIYVFKNFKQYERNEGLESHQKKNGTLTMGGIIFVFPLLILPFFNIKYLVICLSGILFYLIGFIDDLLKIIRKNNLGLSSKMKLLLQIIFGIISSLFFIDNEFNLILFIIFILAYISSSNAYNLTDGCDGLLTSLCLIMGVGWLFIIDSELLYAHIAILGLLSAFLYFNKAKAYIFMGDTGSLFLGAYFCSLAVYYQVIPLFILMNGIIIFETLSVIIQVFYFKFSKGKRLFKMAPFHHHLEALSLSEVMVNFTFILIEVVLVLLSLCLGGYI